MNGLYCLFQKYVSNIAPASAPIDAFLEFLKPVLSTILFLSHWLLSHIAIVKTMDSSERKFESCRNDYHQSLERILGEPGIEPSTSCSPVLQSEQRGSAWQMVVNILWNFCPLVFFFAARPSHIPRARWCLLETMYGWLVVLGFNATLTAKVISWRSVTHMCFLAFLHQY